MKNDDLETVMTILRKTAAKYEKPLTELQRQKNENPFKILTGVLLSSRTRDETTGPAVDRLFNKASSPAEMAVMAEKEIEELIYPVGFYRTKARHIRELARMLIADFKGKVPQSMDDLLNLPGIGRKSANLILGAAFGKPAICVDTHVHRITNRWGYVNTKTPSETEKALRKKLPEKFWIEINRLLVIYGQNVCTPVSARCSACRIEKYCGKIGVDKSR